MGGESGSGQMSEIMKPVLLYVMPGVFGLFLIFMPAVLQVSFFTAATLGMIQGYVFRQPGFREKMGLLPIIPPGTPPPNTKAAQRAQTSSSPSKLRVVTPKPQYSAPTVKSTIDEADSDLLSKMGPVGTAWKDIKKSMDEIWVKANKISSARPNATLGGKESKRDMRELERALGYEKRRKVEREREAEIARRR